MSELEWTEQPLSVSLGRLATATVGGANLYLVRHRDLLAYRVDGDEAVVWQEPVDADTRILLDDRHLQVAMDERGVLYALLGDGSIWRREGNGALVAISQPDVRAAGHYAHRTGFVWDMAGERIVVIGGDRRNDAYQLPAGASELVPIPHGPGHGVGQTVATAHGVYHLLHDELWLLSSQGWELVGRHRYARRDRGVILFWDPQRDALFFVSQQLLYKEAPIRVQMGHVGPSERLKLPGSFLAQLEAHEAVAQIDPGSGRLWCVDRQGARHLDLDRLQLESGCPVVGMVFERPIVTDPPVHWYREAIALRQRDEEAPELDVHLRDGWMLAASLPISTHLPLGQSGSVLLFCREDPYDYEPWTLAFMNAFEVRIVDEEHPLTAGGLMLDQIKYLEPEPIFAERVDTAYDGAPYFARGSKIGGFPSLVQGTKEEAANAMVSDLRCEDCETRLRFVAQLTWPEFDMISAVVYVYACPFGHLGAAHAANV